MRALGVVWGWWAWRCWVGGGTLRPSSSPSIFQIKEFGSGYPIPGSTASQALCPVPDEGIRSVGEVVQPGPRFPETQVLHTLGVGQP